MNPYLIETWPEARLISDIGIKNGLTRRGPLQKVEAEVLDNAEAAGSDPVEALVKAEQAAELYQALEQLKPVDRATLLAFYIRGRSLKQMAREFETPVGTIKRRLHVARNRLKRLLEKACASSVLGNSIAK